MAALMNHSLSRLYSRLALFEFLITSYSFLMGRANHSQEQTRKSWSYAAWRRGRGLRRSVPRSCGCKISGVFTPTYIIYTLCPEGSFSESEPTFVTQETQNSDQSPKPSGKPGLGIPTSEGPSSIRCDQSPQASCLRQINNAHFSS